MDDGNYTKLVNWFDVANRLNAGKCEFYRRIEKEVDWRDEVNSFINSMEEFEGIGIHCLLNDAHGDLFLEMCRVALRANGELK